MFKAVFRFVVTAVLCIGFYALGQMPGSPSIGDIYDWAKNTVQQGTNAPQQAESDQSAGASDTIIAVKDFFRSAAKLTDDAASGRDVSASELPEVQAPVISSRPVADYADASMPKCW